MSYYYYGTPQSFARETQSAPRPSRYYTQSAPQPSRRMPHTQPAPLPSGQMGYTLPASQQSRYYTQSAPRRMQSNVQDSRLYSVPLGSSQRTPLTYTRDARARRGDAFIANDPFRPSPGKNEQDTYDSFDDMPMPTDMAPPVVVVGQPIIPSLPPQPSIIPPQSPVIPSQPPVIPTPPPVIPSQPQIPNIPSRPPTIPTQPIVIPSQPSKPPIVHPQPVVIPSPPPIIPPRPVIIPSPPPIIHPQPVIIPSPAPIIRPQPIVIPSQPPIIPSQPIVIPPGPPPSIIYPNQPYPTQRPQSDWYRPTGATPPFIPTAQSGVFLDPVPATPIYVPYLQDFIPAIYYPNPSFTQIAGEFVTKTLPTQVYLYFLLRLPSLYFSRVARIFEEADLTLPEIKKMALETASMNMVPDDFYALESTDVPPQYMRLKSAWEAFIDSVMREWKTFNIISVLLLSAILTILQIQSAEQDPIIRYTALASLICALISLLFGCMYIIRFGSMRKTYKAAEWALEAKRTRTTVWWNVWVLLAMPVIWLAWSIILYIACIMTFIWRTTSQDVSAPLIMSETTVLVIRVVISSVLGLGIVYAALIMSTFRRYGETMDMAWKRRISGWIETKTGNYGSGQPVIPVQYDVPPSPIYPAPPEVVVPYVSAPPSPSPPSTPSRPLTPTGVPSRYPESDHEILYVPAPPSAREVSRNSSGRKRKKGSAPTSAYGSVLDSQELLGSLPSFHLGDTSRQSISKEPDHEPSSALPQVPMKIYIPQADLPKGAQKQKKRRISVPPASNLPTIPPTPGSSTFSYPIPPVFGDSPPTTGESSRRLNDQNDETTNSEEIEEPQRNSRARAGFQQQPEPQPSVVQPDVNPGQRQAQAEHQQPVVSGPPPYVYDPLYTYADPNAQAWARYYAQGGKDPTGSVYFHFVPGVAPRKPAVAATVSRSQPAMEARPTEQEQQQRQQKYDDLGPV